MTVIDRKAFLNTLCSNILMLIVNCIQERHELFFARREERREVARGFLVNDSQAREISRARNSRLLMLQGKLQRLRHNLRILRRIRDKEIIDNIDFETALDIRYEFFGAFDDVEFFESGGEGLPAHER